VTVATQQRYTAKQPCPVCGGYANLPQGQGRRCYGFLSSDGQYAHCTREELAGAIDFHQDSQSYAHRLYGDCGCGRVHGQEQPSQHGHVHRPRVVSEIVYSVTTSDGQHVEHVRREFADGSKSFYWRRNGEPGLGGYRVENLPLYGIDELADVEPGETVVVVEGEKVRDALTQAKVRAVGTMTGAAGTPSEVSLAPLSSFKVALWPDNDEPGHGHMQRIAERLQDMCVSAGWVTWSEAPKHGDAADFLNGYGGTPEQAQAMVVEAVSAQRSGVSLLDALYDFLGRFVAYPSEHARRAHALWIVHTHLMDAWESTPRLAFLSPEPASGKTRALEVTELLVPRPVEAVNVTPAYLFRKAGDKEGRPTILYDEIDTVFGPKAKDNEEIRGLLNAGHRRGAVAGRCVVRGKVIETEEIPAYCAVAIAGLGGLPDTILSRCVVVRMRRRAPGEHVEPYRRREHAPQGHRLRDKLAAWAGSVLRQAREARPAMPEGVEDRDADAWEPLLAVADLAGGGWPARARVSAVTLVTDSKESTPSLGIRLLADLRGVFGDAEALATTAILERPCKLEEAPWSEVAGGAPLNARGLAQRLKQYGVSSKPLRLGGAVAKGYAREDLWDVWQRYLPSPPEKKVTSVTGDTELSPQHGRGGTCALCRAETDGADLCATCDARAEERNGLPW
jgi:hypothetical protein